MILIVVDTHFEGKYCLSLKNNVFFLIYVFMFKLKITVLALYKALNRALDTERYN